MKKLFLLIIGTALHFLAGCSDVNSHKKNNEIHFATAAEYPPFEYMHHGELKGFDIELAQLIAKKLDKKAVFATMQFSSILPALLSNQVDAAISTITITEERKKNYEFSDPYYFEGMAAVFAKNKPIKSPQQIIGKKVAVQLGSTMEIWLKKQAPNTQIVALDNNNQAIAALNTGIVDLVLMDGAQGAVFSHKNPGLSFAIIAQSENGYGIALKKHNLLTIKINQALKSLNENGELAKLKIKWLENNKWKN